MKKAEKYSVAQVTAVTPSLLSTSSIPIPSSNGIVQSELYESPTAAATTATSR